MSDLFENFDQNLYKKGSPLYKGDGNPLSDISNITPSSIGDGFSTGSTEMVTHALQSGTFQTGVRGWQIDAEGNAEFNNGTFRGTFILGGSLITVSDIADLQSAIDTLELLGGGTASLVPDTYTATSSFTIPSGVVVDGNGSTIDFGGGAFQFLIQGTNAYSTGTLAVSFGSANVVGTGTTWTAAMVGQSILIGDYWYEILTRTDNTHITISPNFQAPDVSGATYVIATTIDQIVVQNITLTNSSTTLLKFRYVNGFTMDATNYTNAPQAIDGDDSANINFQNGSFIDDCTIGLTYNNVPFTVIESVLVSNITGGTALDLNGVTNTSMGSLSLQAIIGVGVKFTNCFNLGFINYSIIECTSHGVECVSGNSAIDLASGYTDTVGGDGIKLTATSDGITLDSQTLKNYTGYGINIAAASCDNTHIGAIEYGGGGSGTLNDSGTGTKVLVDNSSTQTITGVKTFSSDPIIPDEVYGSGWNGVLEPPTKNAVYDKIETLTGTTYVFGTFSYDLSTASGTTVVAHGLGKTPKIVRLIGFSTTDLGATVAHSKSKGTSDGTNNKCIWDASVANATGGSNDDSFALKICGGNSTGTLYQTATITLDSTNITFNWIKTSTPTSLAYIEWEAEA